MNSNTVVSNTFGIPARLFNSKLVSDRNEDESFNYIWDCCSFFQRESNLNIMSVECQYPNLIRSSRMRYLSHLSFRQNQERDQIYHVYILYVIHALITKRIVSHSFTLTKTYDKACDSI